MLRQWKIKLERKTGPPKKAEHFLEELMSWNILEQGVV